MKEVTAWEVADGGLFACKEGALRYEAKLVLLKLAPDLLVCNHPADLTTWLDRHSSQIMHYFGKEELGGHLDAEYAINREVFDPTSTSDQVFIRNNLQAVVEFTEAELKHRRKQP